MAKINAFDFSNSIPVPQNLIEVAKSLAAEPNIASKKWVYNQYDSMVGTVNQSTNAPSDAAIVKVRGSNKSLALTVDCNSRYIYADPTLVPKLQYRKPHEILCAAEEFQQPLPIALILETHTTKKFFISSNMPLRAWALPAVNLQPR